MAYFSIQNADEIEYPVLLKIAGFHGIESNVEYSLLLDNNDSRVNLSALTRLIVSKVTGVDADLALITSIRIKPVYERRNRKCTKRVG